MSNSVRRLTIALMGVAVFSCVSIEVQAQTARQLPRTPSEAAELMRQRAEAERLERERLERERIARERAEQARTDQRSERERERIRVQRERAERERRNSGASTGSCAPGHARAAQTPAGSVLAGVFGPGGPASHARPGCKSKEKKAKNGRRADDDQRRGAGQVGRGSRASSNRGRDGRGRDR